MKAFCHKIRLIAALPLSLLILPLHGQETPNVSDNPPIVSIGFRVLASEKPITDLLFYREGERVEFVASHSVPSEWMTYRGPSPLVFYRQDPGPTNPERPLGAPQPIATFETSESGDWLFLLSENSENTRPNVLSIRAIPEDRSNIVEGIRILNLSSREIALQINDQSIRLSPESSDHLQPGSRSDSSLAMRVAVREAADWELLFSTVLEDRDNRRLTLLVEESNGEIELRKFSEPVPPNSTTAQIRIN